MSRPAPRLEILDRRASLIQRKDALPTPSNTFLSAGFLPHPVARVAGQRCTGLSSQSSAHTRSLADFITTTYGFRFSVRTGESHMFGLPQSANQGYWNAGAKRSARMLISFTTA